MSSTLKQSTSPTKKTATLSNTVTPSPDREEKSPTLISSGRHFELPCFVFRKYDNYFLTNTHWTTVGMLGDFVFVEQKIENQLVLTQFKIGHSFEAIDAVDRLVSFLLHLRNLNFFAPPFVGNMFHNV